MVQTFSLRPTAAELRARLEALLDPGLLQIIDTAGRHAYDQGVPLFLVGGLVRDLLLGEPLTDLDFVVEGNAHQFAASLAAYAALKGIARGRVHLDLQGFGTAHWIAENATFGPVTVDFARARTESYLHPGALPTVSPSVVAIGQDLQRRDFTINALALRLPDLTLIDFYGGLVDLNNGVIRALHAASFIDDPTRIFRAARYAARYRFRLEPGTEALISPALHVVQALSGHRLQREIARLLSEAIPETGLDKLAGWGVLTAIDRDLTADSWTAAAMAAYRHRRARTASSEPQPPGQQPGALQPPTSSSVVAAGWAILLCRAASDDVLKRIAERLDFTVALLGGVRHVWRARQALMQLPAAPLPPPSAFTRAVEPLPEGASDALWATLPFAWQRLLLERYEAEWRHSRPALSGDMLKQMGLPPGPRFGKIVNKLRDMRLDGEISTEQEERLLVQRWIAGESVP
jgi:tRNA nucleotidyltransferase (CCA-adding enzyme)